MDSTELVARYSYWPNKLNYCGPRDANKLILDYVKTGKGKRDVEAAIKQFEAVYPYLKLIAKKNKLKPFDAGVVEAYWLGNSLLKKVTDKDLREHILALTKRGLLKSMAAKLMDNLPSGMVPNHLFHVAYVGCGALTKSVKTTMQNIENCRISWGVVKEIKLGKLVVKHRPLIKRGKRSVFGFSKTKVVDYNKFFLRSIKLKDTVSLHWNFAVQVISKQQLDNLKKFTKHNLKILNKTL